MKVTNHKIKLYLIHNISRFELNSQLYIPSLKRLSFCKMTTWRPLCCKTMFRHFLRLLMTAWYVSI